MDSLAAALKRFLEGHGGRWEGTATELWDELSRRQVQGLPRNPDNLAVKVLAIAIRSKTAMRAERGWRGKNRVLRLQLLKNGVGGVGSVGNQDPSTNTANTANTVPEGNSEKAATITREPGGTPQLSSEERQRDQGRRDEHLAITYESHLPHGCCIHEVPGGCWLCKKYASEDGEEAVAGEQH